MKEKWDGKRGTYQQIIDELTLFDDDLMSRVFDKNIEATEYVLQIILGRKITVVSVKGQENFKIQLQTEEILP